MPTTTMRNRCSTQSCAARCEALTRATGAVDTRALALICELARCYAPSEARVRGKPTLAAVALACACAYRERVSSRALRVAAQSGCTCGGADAAVGAEAGSPGAGYSEYSQGSLSTHRGNLSTHRGTLSTHRGTLSTHRGWVQPRCRSGAAQSRCEGGRCASDSWCASPTAESRCRCGSCARFGRR
jgi:hypothetical protein